MHSSQLVAPELAREPEQLHAGGVGDGTPPMFIGHVGVDVWDLEAWGLGDDMPVHHALRGLGLSVPGRLVSDRIGREWIRNPIVGPFLQGLSDLWSCENVFTRECTLYGSEIDWVEARETP